MSVSLNNLQALVKMRGANSLTRILVKAKVLLLVKTWSIKSWSLLYLRSTGIIKVMVLVLTRLLREIKPCLRKDRICSCGMIVSHVLASRFKRLARDERAASDILLSSSWLTKALCSAGLTRAIALKMLGWVMARRATALALT